MQELHFSDVSQVSGGASYIDYDTWLNVQQKALTDGAIVSTIVTSLTFAFTAGVSGGLATPFMVSAAVAPYAGFFGYINSSSWNIIS